MRLSKACNICSKPLEEVYSGKLDDGKSSLMFYKCGHFSFKESSAQNGSTYPYFSLDHTKEAYDFQKEFLPFVEENNYSVLNADQMGLGKTVQGLLALRHKYDSLTPCLIIVKSATLWQWNQQYKTWCDATPLGIFMIRDGKSYIPPGFKSYLVSMDTFSRLVNVEINNAGHVKNVFVNKHLKNLGIKFIIADECQSFKNQESKRTRALVGFVQVENIEHKIFLSGTPIKNRADEYFVVLNLLSPERFPSIEKFRRQWLVQDGKGKWSRVNPYLEDEFREEISNIVIRRETADVKKDLPPFRRTFEIINIEDDHLKEVYNKEIERMQATADSKANLTYMDVSDHLMTLRRIVGMAKVDLVVEYIDTFLDTVEDEKICIGIHHKAVRDLLFYKLEQRKFRPLKLSGEDNSDQKEQIKREFQKPDRRVCIMNMLSGGVGMDGFQVCNNILGMERQWTSVDEEQFEARFHRDGQTRPVLCEYWIAKGTIDEFFSNMVEEKRHIFGKTVGNNWDLMGDPLMLKDLVEQTMRNKL